MKHYLYLFLSLILSSKTFCKSPVVYFFGDLTVAFEKIDGVFVNKSCVNKRCQAYKAYQKFKNKKIEPDFLIGGKNPSSVRCSKFMGGEVLIGQDILGNKQSVCKFKDKSFLL